MNKHSNKDTDGTIWTDVSLPLGATGLDLRRPDDPSTLTKLDNASFLDTKTVIRREGHSGRSIQDKSAFVMEKQVTRDWVYGHGTVIRPSTNQAWENVSHPISVQGKGTFLFGDTDVVWTGDRMLVLAKDGPAYGESPHWARLASDTPIKKGIPAFIPVVTDSVPGDAVTGDYMDTCLTETLRIIVYTTPSNRVAVVVSDRETGVVILRSFVDAGGSPPVPVHVRAVVSGGIPMLFWISGSVELLRSYWTGTAWSAASAVAAEVASYDVTQTSGGCMLVYRVGAALYATQYSGHAAVGTLFPPGTALYIDVFTPNGAVAVSVASNGDVAVVWQSARVIPPNVDLVTLVYDKFLSVIVDTILVLKEDTTVFNKGLTCAYRGLAGQYGRANYLVYAGNGANVVTIWEVSSPIEVPFTETAVAQTYTMYNSTVASKAFKVGDEVFTWLRATNSSTHYLAAGCYKANTCGYADREEALARAVSGDVMGIAGVGVDPLSNGTVLTWIRPFEAGTYTHPGNVRVGDIDFVPELSTAAYGKSVYVAGSSVRCWDGKDLGDAGFHDYPLGELVASTGAGALTLLATYQVRVYATRYNGQGEKFTGVAITSAPKLLAGTENTITVTINCIPCTNHDDVVFEVFSTPGNSTVFYLAGTVLNSRTAGTVTFDLVKTDANLATGPGDPHAPTVDGLAELEESAPLGCSILVTASDRLWGIGGQVPAGLAQFSKLYEVGEGVGFDALAGTQVLDATGGVITSITNFGDARVVGFQQDKLFVVTDYGPNNYGVGTFGVPQLVIAEGAVNHAGTIVLPDGIGFWGIDGPRLLTPNFRVLTISEPVIKLTKAMTPSGVRIDKARREVVWYTSAGTAVLWNYNGGRWARWTGLPVAGCSSRLLVTTDGRVLAPASVSRDDGRRFTFGLATGNIRPEQLLDNHTLVRRIGITGEQRGSHEVNFKLFYDGSPLWSDKFKWEPAANTWLTLGEAYENLTPTEIDSLSNSDHSGAYITNKRVSRQDCRFFRVEISDGGALGFTPWELSIELGEKPGLGRTAVNTFTR